MYPTYQESLEQNPFFQMNEIEWFRVMVRRDREGTRLKVEWSRGNMIQMMLNVTVKF
jgi:hypothetical protein